MGFLFIYGTVNAHMEHEQPKDLSGIGIDEKLGQVVPLDLTFQDENGNAVNSETTDSSAHHSHPSLFTLPEYLQFPIAEFG